MIGASSFSLTAATYGTARRASTGSLISVLALLLGEDDEVRPTELVSLLTDAEWLYRENKKLASRLQHARLRRVASLEELDYSHARSFSKPQVLERATPPRGWPRSRTCCSPGPPAWARASWLVPWGRRPIGMGTRWCTAAPHACLTSSPRPAPTGTHRHALRRLAKAHVLIPDDFGLEPLGAAERKELLEVLEDRYQQSSTVVTSQLEPKDWHAVIGGATLSDAILDRLVHNSHRLKLAGDSIRKVDANFTKGRKQAK